MKTKCKVTEYISAYLDKELSADKAELVEMHLENCNACKEEYESIAGLTDILNSLPVTELPEVMMNRLLTIPRHISKKEYLMFNMLHYLRPLPIAASIILSLVSAVMIGNSFIQTDTTDPIEYQFAQESLYSVWEGIAYE